MPAKLKKLFRRRNKKQQDSTTTTPPPLESADTHNRSRRTGRDETSSSILTNSMVSIPASEGEEPELALAYDNVPLLEQTKLPRGGVSVETSAVGRIQFGIPPETIKDSMKLGLPVPQVYIVPVDRFCRDMGPALGVNLAEFEFPAYFNFFVYKKRCTLIVDSNDAEENIRRVFSETLLGPEQFRRRDNPIPYEPEDFDPSFPVEAIPNFQKELHHFRIMPDGSELVIETLLDFCHFECHPHGHDHLALPPSIDGRRPSFDLDEQCVELLHGTDLDEDDLPEEAVPLDETEVEKREKKNPWTYSHARFNGDVACVWPTGTTEEQKRQGKAPRVEIFKMPGGTEYIIHDVDENNHIVGKARLTGHVKVSESMSVDGFGGHSIMDEFGPKKEAKELLGDESEKSHQLADIVKPVAPPTFHPPSFGVTVLGNSHGFDATGSVSGYVLWINGRGVMIDPPPYSSATLEREGIRPRTIVGIILTHCHADHDAGAFQKVLTGSPVVVITTPTIYKSFIRKYAALSALSPALLRHCHRFKPAIIGQPLRFQGATFHFTYTLHSIPCVGFRVEWRGRSMVFTGDHYNSPKGMKMLQEKGVLSKARADDLTQLPLQDTDLLLHESGAPPIHTPLEVLLELPKKVKDRLYVVHTSALPEDCELKVAPTGTKGTIRLDKLDSHGHQSLSGSKLNMSSFSISEDGFDEVWKGPSEYCQFRPDDPDGRSGRGGIGKKNTQTTSFLNLEAVSRGNDPRTSLFVSNEGHMETPLVALRPASSTDAWFLLNLLSAVPFISSLSYSSTMELLETARVDAFRQSDIVLPADRRNSILCVVWEGTCAERPCIGAKNATRGHGVWHPGDWSGPITLQPDHKLSGESKTSSTNDIVAVSWEGVKVITVEYSSLHLILKNGSSLYRKYLERKILQDRARRDTTSDQHSSATEKMLDDALKDLNVLELLNCNSALRKLSAVQKRHLESLAEGPISFQPGERIWRAGSPVDKAFVIVSGSASFVPRRRNAGSATDGMGSKGGIGETMMKDAHTAIKELGKDCHGHESDAYLSAEHEEKMPGMSFEKVFSRTEASDQNNLEFEELRRGLVKRAHHVNSESSVASNDLSAAESHGSFDTDNEFQMDGTDRSGRTSLTRRRSSNWRRANKVLGRLYNRRAFTGGLIFSRGHFLGDISKMVAGLLAPEAGGEGPGGEGPEYGFGDTFEGEDEKDSFTGMVIAEEGASADVAHNSTLTAGKDGCVVLVFPKSSLIPFLDQYPGLLLSLLGTQVVV